MKNNTNTQKFKIFFFLFFLSISVSNAQTKKISIQGFLKDGNSKAVDNGQYELTFKLYTVSTGGTAIWTETNSRQITYFNIFYL
jgi:hypothetical protein